jgi:hypothetical protein
MSLQILDSRLRGNDDFLCNHQIYSRKINGEEKLAALEFMEAGFYGRFSENAGAYKFARGVRI